MKAGGRVFEAGCVAQERKNTSSSILATGCVAVERIKTCSRVVATCCITPQRANAGGRILAAGSIAEERFCTAGRVVAAGCVAPERLRAVSCVVVTVVVKKRSKASGRVEAASVVGAHRINSISRVAVSQSVARKGVPAYACIVALRTVSERLKTDGCVVVNVGTAIKRLKSDGSVFDASCKTKECVFTLSGVLIGIAAVRWRDNCLRILQKRKACECEQREPEISNIRYCFHGFYFLFCFFSVVSRCNGEVVSHLHLESVTAPKIEYCVDEDCVRAWWQRPQQDPVAVGDAVLLRAGYARVEGHERWIAREGEEPRRSAVTEQVVQGPPIHNDFQLRH